MIQLHYEIVRRNIYILGKQKTLQINKNKNSKRFRCGYQKQFIFILDDHQKSDFDNGIDFFVEHSHIQEHPRNHFEFNGRNLVVDTGFKCSWVARYFCLTIGYWI